MNLIDLVNRNPEPQPWEEGDNIPWSEPDFSQRMLIEHLSQDHNAASRKSSIIQQHIQWIHEVVLSEKPSKILDLGCGPGLYCHRLSSLGHHCFGIDYSPASIAYARQVAIEDHLNTIFTEADLREADYGTGFDVVMQIYGEINVFRPNHASLILKKAYQALKPGGILILEPHTFDAVQAWGTRSPSWYSSKSGLFATGSHLVLEEYFWDKDQKVATNRYFTINASSGSVIQYAQSVQAYTEQDYTELLEKCGFENIHFFPSLTGKPDPQQPQLIAILASKPENL